MDFFDTKGKKVKYQKDFSWRPAVYGLLVENNKMLFIQPNWDNKFCLPGGAINLGETPIQAMEREFLEETGYKVKADPQPIYVDSQLFGSHELNKFFQRINLYYKVKIISKKQQTDIDKESTQIIWKDIKKLQTKDFTFFQKNFLKIVLNK